MLSNTCFLALLLTLAACTSGKVNTNEGSVDDTSTGEGEGEGEGEGSAYSTGVGIFEVLTTETYVAGDQCLISAAISSASPSDCPDCTFSFDWSFTESGATTCSGNGFEGAVFGLGAGSLYGYDYVLYDYYGDWVPIFDAVNYGDYATFYDYTYYDYAYTYYDPYTYEYVGVYYLTDVRYGYMQAYE